MDIKDLVFNKANGAGPTDLPSEWEVIPLIEGVSKIDYGLSKAIPKTPPLNGVKIVSTADITPDGDLLYWKIRPTEAPEKTRNRLALVDGDVLFNWRNSANLIGKTAIYHEQEDEHIFASFILRIDCRGSRLDNHFLKYLMRFYREAGIFMKLSRRAVNQANYNKNEISVLRIPLPPLPEQKKIAHIVSTVQRAIEAQERIIQTTTELKRALMHKLFTEGLRNEPQKQTEIGPIPESWKLVPIGDLFETQLGKMLSQKAKVGDSPKPYLRNKNVQWGRVDTDDLLRMDFNDREAGKFLLQKGDLSICEGGEVGRAALWDGSITECYYQKALHRLRTKTDKITNEYMAHWMMFAFLLTNTYGVTGTRTTIAHLPEIKLKPLLVPIPAPEERDEIVHALDSSEQKIENHRRKHVQLQDLFRTLLHELMTAKTRVHNLDCQGPLSTN